MNKKIYQQPAMRAVKIQHTQMVCTSDPSTHDEPSDKPGYARSDVWADDDIVFDEE